MCIFELIFSEERLKLTSLNQLTVFSLISVSANMFKTNLYISMQGLYFTKVYLWIAAKKLYLTSSFKVA